MATAAAETANAAINIGKKIVKHAIDNDALGYIVKSSIGNHPVINIGKQMLKHALDNPGLEVATMMDQANKAHDLQNVVDEVNSQSISTLRTEHPEVSQIVNRETRVNEIDPFKTSDSTNTNSLFKPGSESSMHDKIFVGYPNDAYMNSMTKLLNLEDTKSVPGPLSSKILNDYIDNIEGNDLIKYTITLNQKLLDAEHEHNGELFDYYLDLFRKTSQKLEDEINYDSFPDEIKDKILSYLPPLTRSEYNKGYNYKQNLLDLRKENDDVQKAVVATMLNRIIANVRTSENEIPKALFETAIRYFNNAYGSLIKKNPLKNDFNDFGREMAVKYGLDLTNGLERNDENYQKLSTVLDNTDDPHLMSRLESLDDDALRQIFTYLSLHPNYNPEIIKMMNKSTVLRKLFNSDLHQEFEYIQNGLLGRLSEEDLENIINSEKDGFVSNIAKKMAQSELLKREFGRNDGYVIDDDVNWKNDLVKLFHEASKSSDKSADKSNVDVIDPNNMEKIDIQATFSLIRTLSRMVKNMARTRKLPSSNKRAAIQFLLRHPDKRSIKQSAIKNAMITTALGTLGTLGVANYLHKNAQKRKRNIEERINDDDDNVINPDDNPETRPNKRLRLANNPSVVAEPHNPSIFDDKTTIPYFIVGFNFYDMVKLTGFNNLLMRIKRFFDSKEVGKVIYLNSLSSTNTPFFKLTPTFYGMNNAIGGFNPILVQFTPFSKDQITLWVAVPKDHELQYRRWLKNVFIESVPTELQRYVSKTIKSFEFNNCKEFFVRKIDKNDYINRMPTTTINGINIYNWN